MKHEITHINGSVLYVAEIPDDTPSGLATRAALEAAVKSSAYLARANLAGAYLGGADLGGADGLKLSGRRPVLQIGPIGSRCAFLVSYITNQGVYVRAGCWFGTLADFGARVVSEHGTSDHAVEYAAAIQMIEAHARLWAPATEAA